MHDKYIEVIQSTGFDFNKYLAFAGSGIGNIFVPENIGAAMLVKTKGFHLFFVILSDMEQWFFFLQSSLSIAKRHLRISSAAAKKTDLGC